MKRKAPDNRTGDGDGTGNIKADLTEKQLAAFGAAALAYNVLEDQIDALLFAATRIPDWLFTEVSSRIHGLDGKIAIIQEAIKHSDLVTATAASLTAAVALFGDLKKTRDTIIHARITNVRVGVGRGAKQRGKSPYEVLLNVEALTAFYDHVVALKDELASGAALLEGSIILKQSGADDPNRTQIEEALRVQTARYQENHNRRRAMKPIPKFPDEEELRQAANLAREAQTAALMGWFRQPQLPPQTRSWFLSDGPAIAYQPPPVALLEAEREKNRKK
jgi:hypothetical protein